MTTVEGTPSEATRLRRANPLRQLLTRPEFGSIVGAILIFFVFWALTGFTVGSGFMSWKGFSAYIQVAAQIGILGATVALLMIAGEFDLSIGSMVGCAGLILGLSITQYHLPLWLGLILTFAFALAIGAANGYIVVKTGLPSFIVTLGSLYMLRGAGLAMTRLLSNGQTIVSGRRCGRRGRPAREAVQRGPVHHRRRRLQGRADLVDRGRRRRHVGPAADEVR